ncbi:nicotinate-nucleotide adenylyltransferase [Paenibacillus senegalensis]|uniref:nicotinate-nucleotide adenylyltransferase n=1 Tax=Paenibacillus senegalensis TaxID=1465766 RepID=UPI000287C279|nr:nicotinate-nucleotide adenylyltransferase [Paenibacillus senegalensis]
MKIGIMGGTFDPIHNGHLLAAETAREQAGLDEVWFMPANVPPHKANAPKATAEQRLFMVEEAIASHDAFKAKDIELARGGTSYTTDTVEKLRNQYPDYNFYYIIGADMVMYLPNWNRIEQLVSMIGFIGVTRAGYGIDLNSLPEPIRKQVQLCEMPNMELSSTDIRERRRHGKDIRYRVPDSVRTYIGENRLYEA